MTEKKLTRGVETETTLVGTQGRVELDTETAVDLELTLVVLPDDTELDDTLGDGDDLEGLAVLRVLLEEGRVLEGRGELYTGRLSASGSSLHLCSLLHRGGEWGVALGEGG